MDKILRGDLNELNLKIQFPAGLNFKSEPVPLVDGGFRGGESRKFQWIYRLSSPPYANYGDLIQIIK
ncbi:MAG TPA: hypothetical protein VHO48_01165 [Anaerolineaceae bacterium]|nr:hypothetical protein [Anaerolineaceae bacterium]